MNKDLKKIFLTLGLYSFACGIFYNFQQLWMMENNLSLKTISTVYSLCALITVSIIFLCSNIIKQDKLKKFTCALLLIKTILMFLLFILHNSGLNVLIKFIIMLEYALDVEAFTCIYPLITLITKDDKIYSIYEILYSLIYYTAVLLVGLFLGKSLFAISIDYNFYCLLGSIFVFISFIVLSKVDLSKYYNKDKIKADNNDILFKLIKNIKDDKISKHYLLFVLTGNISFYCVTNLMLLLLTTSLNYEPSTASNIILALGIISSFLGLIIMEKLTLKNNYINLLIKLGGRLIAYIFAFLIVSKYVTLIALIYTKVFADSYYHVFDAPYINRYSGEYQLAFCNLKRMANYFSRAIGTFLCGLFITNHTNYLFLISGILVLFQIIAGFKAQKLRTIESKEVI